MLPEDHKDEDSLEWDSTWRKIMPLHSNNACMAVCFRTMVGDSWTLVAQGIEVLPEEVV